MTCLRFHRKRPIRRHRRSHFSRSIRTPRLDGWTRVSHAWIGSHPYIFRSVTGFVIVLFLGLGWFVYDIVAKLPDRDQLKALGDTSQGTTLFDVHDRPIFSIPTQYQIEVPLVPHLSRISRRPSWP